MLESISKLGKEPGAEAGLNTQRGGRSSWIYCNKIHQDSGEMAMRLDGEEVDARSRSGGSKLRFQDTACFDSAVLALLLQAENAVGVHSGRVGA